MKSDAQLDSCVCRWPTQRARDWISGFLDRVQQDPDALAVVAIGSAVRHGVLSDDLDIVVIHRSPQTFKERPPLDIDLRVFDVSDVDTKIAAGHDLLGWAVVFGRAMFDRDDTWLRTVEQWAGLVPLPSPAVAQARAAKSFKRLNEMRKIGDEEAALELEVAYLSHLARGVLAEAGVRPASRPELPDQLRTVGAQQLADEVAGALDARAEMRKEFIGPTTARTLALRPHLGPPPRSQ